VYSSGRAIPMREQSQNSNGSRMDTSILLVHHSDDRDQSICERSGHQYFLSWYLFRVGGVEMMNGKIEAILITVPARFFKEYPGGEKQFRKILEGLNETDRYEWGNTCGGGIPKIPVKY